MLSGEMSERIIFLVNKSANCALSAAEQEELDDLLGGGDDRSSNGSDDNDHDWEPNDGDGDSDDGISDHEGPYVNDPPLPDMAALDLANDLLENVLGENVLGELVDEPAQAIGANRGQQYLGQGRGDRTVWWSMPSVTEKARTDTLAADRKSTIPFCTTTFEKKKDAFRTILTTSIVEEILLATNQKARRAMNTNAALPNPKKMRPWRDLTVNELYAFIGLVIYAGAEKSNLVEAKDLFAKDHMPIYRATMSLKRFEQICRYLRFDDSRTRGFRLQSDKLAPFRHIWTLFLNNLTLNYMPSKELCIDEQLLNTRNRCMIRQYIPSKPGKYGIKINWIVDAPTSFPLFGEIYLGTQPNEARSTGIAHQLVIRLANRWLNNGANITMDNFFTSYALGKDLWTNYNTTIVGTIRTNKREIPVPFSSAAQAKQRGKFASVFCFSDECQLTSYTSNTLKNVVLLSTAHQTENIDSNSRTKKPVVILDYNKFKGGVDTFDQMIRGSTCKRKCNRWPMCLFYNMIDVGAFCAFRLFELCHPSWHPRPSDKRKVFLKELALELITPHLKDRCKLPLKKSTLEAMKLIGFKPPIPPSTIPHASEQVISEDLLFFGASIHVILFSLSLFIYFQNKLQRCVPCKSARTAKVDVKTRSVCELCLVPSCPKHYIKVCERCYLNKFIGPSDDDDSDDDYDNRPTTSAGRPAAPRVRNRSPLALTEV